MPLRRELGGLIVVAMKLAMLVACLVACGTATAPPRRPIANCMRPVAATPGLQGRWFDIGRVSELTAGESTLADARCALGEPTMTTDSADGTSMVSWMYMTAGKTNGALTMNGANAMLQFDSNGRLLQVVAATRTH